MVMSLRYLPLLLVTSCGQFVIKGGTKNEVVTTGTTTHTIVLKVDTSLCDGQADVPACIGQLTTMLEQFLETLKQTKEIEK